MSPADDIRALFGPGPYDRAMIERLGKVDRAELRETLSTYLDDDAVNGIVRRIDELVAGLAKG